MDDTLLIACGVLLPILVVYSYKQLHRNDINLPGPIGLPGLGNAFTLLRRGDLAAVIRDWTLTHGRVFKFFLSGQQHVVFSDPIDIRKVLGSPKFNLRWKNADSALQVLDMKDAGVVMNSDPVLWKLHRTMFSGALKGTSLLRALARVACDNADKLVECHLLRKPGEAVNVSACFKLFSLDTIGSIAFGTDFHALDHGQEHVLMNCVVQFYKAWDHFLLTPPWMLMFMRSKSRKYLEYVRILRKIEMETVAAARQKLQEGLGDENAYDFPTRLIKQQQKEMQSAREGSLSDKLICEDIREMILGGTDTTSNSLTFIAYHLARYPEEAQMVREELESVLPEDPQHPDFLQSLSKLPYTDAFIKEVSRMYSVVPLLLHASSEDETIGSVFIPKGTNVVLHQAASSMDPRYVDQPELFQPSRWRDPEKALRLSKASFPFGYGPRNCPGQQVAWIEMRCALFRILRRAHVQLSKEGQLLETEYDILSHAKGDELLLRFEPRN